MRRSLAILLVLLSSAVAFGKNEPIVLVWPSDSPALRLTFDKFRQQGTYSGQNVYLSDVTVENLTEKLIPHATFTVNFFDKNKIRIGQGTLLIADLDAKESARMQFQFNSVGIPSTLSLSARKDMLTLPGPKTVSLRVVSVPPGAKLKVDGQDGGLTPVLVRLTVGVHQLDLLKEGYAPGSTPVEITPDELPGGSITIELGGLSGDTVELRDGTVLLGDVISMSMTEVAVRVDGNDKTYPRNQVKKIILVERITEQRPAVVQPAPSAQSK